MNYNDDELAEEKSFKINGNDDEEETFEDLDDSLEPEIDNDLNFDKEEEEKDTY